MSTETILPYTPEQPTEKEFVLVLERAASSVFNKLPYNIQTSITLGDFVSEGYLGAREEAEQFNSGRGVKFKDYIWPRARGAMIDYLRAEDFVTRPYRDREKKIAKVRQELSCRLDHTPSYDELALELGQERLARIKEDIALIRNAGKRLRATGEKVHYPVKNSSKGRQEL